MKIKFKQTKAANITNITFDFCQSKQLAKKLSLRKDTSNSALSMQTRYPSTAFEN